MRSKTSVWLSRRTSASFPEKAEAKPQVVFGGLLGDMASGRVWRAKPAILLHTATPEIVRRPGSTANPLIGSARPRFRAPGLASESGRGGRLSNQPSEFNAACGNYLHVSLFFGNFAI